jgi:hypothetical protein
MCIQVSRVSEDGARVVTVSAKASELVTYESILSVLLDTESVFKVTLEDGSKVSLYISGSDSVIPMPIELGVIYPCCLL